MKNNARLEYEITGLLQKYRFPLHLKGSQYLASAIIEWINGTRKLDAIYKTVARKHHTTAANAEKCARYCTKQSSITYKSINPKRTSPTNGEIIAALAHEIEGLYI